MPRRNYPVEQTFKTMTTSLEAGEQVEAQGFGRRTNTNVFLMKHMFALGLGIKETFVVRSVSIV